MTTLNDALKALPHDPDGKVNVQYEVVPLDGKFHAVMRCMDNGQAIAQSRGFASQQEAAKAAIDLANDMAKLPRTEIIAKQ